MKGKEKKMEKQKQKTQDAIELLEEKLGTLEQLESIGIKQPELSALRTTISMLKKGIPMLSFICDIEELFRSGVRSKKAIMGQLKHKHQIAADAFYFDECYKIAKDNYKN